MTAIWTNDDVEGWYNRQNPSVATQGPVSFYHLVSVLYMYCEVTDIILNVKVVSEVKMQRYQGKKTRQMLGRVFSLWWQDSQRNINASQLV